MTSLARAAALAVAMLSAGAGAALAQSNVPGQPFSDCGDCPVMVAIPPGSFKMGVPPGEEEREGVPGEYRGWSEPQHRVKLSRAFAIGQHEVTREQFAAFVSAAGYQAGDSCWLWTLNNEKHRYEWQERAGDDWRDPGFAQTDRDPVVCVSFDDAMAYVAWLSKRTGQRYRLSSEVEWEFAARAGSGASRYWDEDRSQACGYANVRDLSLMSAYNLVKKPDTYFPCSDGYANTAPVGSFTPNSFGLYDMLGNVWEWVADCWNAIYVGAPADGSAWTKGDCSRRVDRGGSWLDHPWNVRAGFRGGVETGSRVGHLGFRVARTL